MDKKDLTVSYAENKSHCMFYELLDKNCRSRYLGGEKHFCMCSFLTGILYLVFSALKDVCITPLTLFNPVKCLNQILD